MTQSHWQVLVWLANLEEPARLRLVAKFFYGYGNNYTVVNISNLDLLLFSLQKYAPKARVIVLVDKASGSMWTS